MPTATVDERATELLRALGGPDAGFRPHQLEAVRDLVDERGRVLCVQRTGWGKSAVYFLATALLRERGAGPALIVSLLLISPERLNNPQFRDTMLPLFAERVGLLVVDEAHCISDWGHDFRPDYRRLAEMLERLPDG